MLLFCEQLAEKNPTITLWHSINCSINSDFSDVKKKMKKLVILN
jgi:hypothetical protein